MGIIFFYHWWDFNWGRGPGHLGPPPWLRRCPRVPLQFKYWLISCMFVNLSALEKGILDPEYVATTELQKIRSVLIQSSDYMFSDHTLPCVIMKCNTVLPEMAYWYYTAATTLVYLDISNKMYLEISGADLCWALGGIICNFTPILPYFQLWGGWTWTTILLRCWNLVKTKRKMQIEHFFSPNSGEDQKKKVFIKKRTLFLPDFRWRP